MRIPVEFPGNLAVSAVLDGRRVRTDQPARYGGDDSAPPPFDLFLASIATCAGFYALRFCQKRNLDTDGLGLELVVTRDESGKRVEHLGIEIKLPEDFPEKYQAAILRSVDLCAVKRHILEPPEFSLSTA